MRTSILIQSPAAEQTTSCCQPSAPFLSYEVKPYGLGDSFKELQRSSCFQQEIFTCSMDLYSVQYLVFGLTGKLFPSEVMADLQYKWASAVITKPSLLCQRFVFLFGRPWILYSGQCVILLTLQYYASAVVCSDYKCSALCLDFRLCQGY